MDSTSDISHHRPRRVATDKPHEKRPSNHVETDHETLVPPAIESVNTNHQDEHETFSDPMMTSTNSLDPVLGHRNYKDADEVDSQETRNSIVKLSRRRWLILLAMSVFGMSMGFSNDTGPVLNLILELLDMRIDNYVYLQQIFSYMMVVVALPSACYVDKYGLRQAIYTAASFYVVQGTFKFLLYMPSLKGWHELRMFYYVISSLINFLVGSLYFLLPLKISETWFSERERSVAWTAMFVQMELGVCISSYLYPRIMPTLDQIQILAYVNIVAISVTFVTCLACVTRAAPKHPPSERSAKALRENPTDFVVSFKRMLKDKQIIIHVLHLAIIEACVITISSILQDILLSVGQTKYFVGNFMSINTLFSIIMNIVMAFFVHKLKNISFAVKLGSAVMAIVYVIYLTTLISRSSSWSIIAISIILTICKSWVLPNFTNMTAHLTCGLVSHATIIGFSITLTVICITIVQVSFVKLAIINDAERDYTHSLMFLIIVAIINELSFQLMFRGKKTDEQMDDNQTSSDLDQSVQRQINFRNVENADYEPGQL